MSIAPLPVSSKQKRLELGIKLMDKSYIRFNVEKELLNHLRYGPMTISQLCEKIVARRNNIHNHLSRLKKKNIVEVCSNKALGKGGELIWKLS